MFLRSYRSSLILIAAIIAGALTGLLLKERTVVLKPLGDIFLNFLFTIVVPLVFFSIASTVAKMEDVRQLGKILGWMAAVFVVTGIIAALVMLAGVLLYPPVQEGSLTIPPPAEAEPLSLGEQLTRTVSVPDFGALFSKHHILPLILFAFLTGLATSAAGEKGKAFAQFLESGNEVMSRAISILMSCAPVGLGAYFAYLAGTFGTHLFSSYARAAALYYPLALIYFGTAFSFYAWLAGGTPGLKRFWNHILPPSLTAWGTGSGLATLPVNLEAARKIGIPEDVRDMVVNIGASIHSDGSCLAAVMKIALLFGIYGRPLEGLDTFLAVIGVALLCGTVISGIPTGGILGELLIINIFGFPLESMPLITMLGSLVDPPATTVNVAGDNVCGMLVARLTHGPDWLKKSGASETH